MLRNEHAMLSMQIMNGTFQKNKKVKEIVERRKAAMTKWGLDILGQLLGKLTSVQENILSYSHKNINIRVRKHEVRMDHLAQHKKPKQKMHHLAQHRKAKWKMHHLV